MNSGIYTITSPSGNKYVGSAVNFKARWRQHRHELRRGTHFNNGLQRASSKYGIENLSFKPILVCAVGDLLFFEQRAIDILKPQYNACRTAGSQLGRKHRPESNAKNAAAHRGRKQSMEQRLATSKRLLGNKNNLGRKSSLETRAKQSASLKGKRPPDCFEARATEMQKRQLAAEYTSGAGLVDLASKHGTDHRIMRRVLVEEGVVIRDAKFRPGQTWLPEVRAKQSTKGKHHRDGFKARLTDPLKNEIINDYLGGFGLLRLASKYRTSHKTLRPILVEACLTIRPSGRKTEN